MASQFRPGVARTTDGCKLAYKTGGSGEVNILFMHGWASTKDYFDEAITRMDLTGLRICCFDLRGHGHSPEATDNYSSQRLAEDMLSVADAAGMARFISVGHSMAGKYIQYVPILARERVLGQVLIAGTPAGSIAVDDAVIAEWAGYSGNRDALRRSHHAIITRPIRHEISEKWVAQASAISRHVLETTLEVCFRDDISAQVASTKPPPPTLIIAAQHDPFFPVVMMRAELQEKIQGARMVVLDCGHEIPNELARETAMLIEAFAAGAGS